MHVIDPPGLTQSEDDMLEESGWVDRER